MTATSGFDRRDVVRIAIWGVVGGLVVPRGVVASQMARAELTPLNDRITLVTSGGTNVLALSTDGGLVLVDSGAPDLSDRLMASLVTLSGGRVARVFNTHWHLDNTAANEQLRARGAAVIAHQNTRLWMATPTWIPAEDRYRQPRPPVAHPDQTFYADGSMNVGGERIDYAYLIDAHTSSDIYVFFRESNVLAVGDVVSPVRDPELDYFTGAWIGGRVDALERIVALSNAGTRIVPGYGPVLSRAQVESERDVMRILYERVVDRVRQGDDADEMLGGGVMNGLARTWKDPRKFLYDVHKGLWAHHNKLSPDVV